MRPASYESTQEAHKKMRYQVTSTEVRLRLGISCREACETSDGCRCDVLIENALRRSATTPESP